jgi:hypothetical protein
MGTSGEAAGGIQVFRVPFVVNSWDRWDNIFVAVVMSEDVIPNLCKVRGCFSIRGCEKSETLFAGNSIVKRAT